MTTISALFEGFDTARLTARRIVAQDRDGLRSTLLNPGLEAAFGHAFDPEAFVATAAQRWGEDCFVLTLLLRGEARIVGFATVRPELFAIDGVLAAGLEIALDPAVHRQGLGSEVMPALIGWAFDALVYPLGRKLDRLYMLCRAANAASIGLMLDGVRFGVRDLGEDDEVRLPTDAESYRASMVTAVEGAQEVSVGKLRVFAVWRTEFRHLAV